MRVYVQDGLLYTCKFLYIQDKPSTSGLPVFIVLNVLTNVKKKSVMFILTVVYHVSYSCTLKWRVLDMVLIIKVKYIFCNNLTISYFFSVSQTVMQAWHLSTIQFWCCLTYRTNGHSYWCKNHKTRYGKSGHA
jgi:hypothetical protein